MTTNEIIKVLMHAIAASDGTYTNVERRYNNQTAPGNIWVNDPLPSEYRITPEPE